MDKTIVIATKNTGKLDEIRAILSETGYDFVASHQLEVKLDVAETGQSYLENARLKARAYQRHVGGIVLADDSGLEVDALAGAPGIYSARYSPKPNAGDADRRAFLLEQLSKHPQPWQAQFQCAIVVALPDGKTIESVGSCHGMIIPKERGTGGFGYDPIFLLPDFSMTMAELPATVKNEISHRARALQSIKPALMLLS